MRRFSTILALAFFTLLFASISSAQQTSVPSDEASGINPLSATNTYIPYFLSTSGYTDSIMSQPSLAGINVNNGNFNLTNFANAYRIGGKVVLAVGDYPSGSRNLSVGVGAGRADASGGNSNTVVGASAGTSNNSLSSFNVFLGGSAGSLNTSGGYSTCVGVGACFSSNPEFPFYLPTAPHYIPL